MNITINGKISEFEKELTVKQLLDQGYAEMQEYVTVQVNEDIIPRTDYENIIIQDGSTIEFLYYMGGGCNLK